MEQQWCNDLDAIIYVAIVNNENTISVEVAISLLYNISHSSLQCFYPGHVLTFWVRGHFT